MCIKACAAWFSLCLHDCSHLAFSFKAFSSQLAKLGAQLALDLWDLTSAEVPSDSEVRGKRKAKEEQLHTFLRRIAGWTHSVRLHKRGVDCISFAVIVFVKKAYGRAYRQFTVV